MTLVVAPGAHHVATADGVLWLTDTGPVRYTGPSIARWCDRLVPLLDGSRTLAELTVGLAPARAAMVVRVVTALVGAGVVIDQALRSAGGVRPMVVVAGSAADALRAAVGPRAITCAPDRLSQVEPGAAVLHLATAADEDRCTLIDELAPGPVAHAVVWRDHAWLSAGWPPGWAAHRMRREPGPPTTPQAPALAEVAVRLVHAAATRDTRLTRLDLRTGTTSHHRPLPHPFAVTCAPPRAFLPTGPRLSVAELAVRLHRCVDPLVGIITAVTEDDLVQVPANLATALRGSRRFTAHGADFVAARVRACLDAVAAYADELVDPRRGGRWAFPQPGGDPVPVPADHPGVAAAGADWAEVVERALGVPCSPAVVIPLDHDPALTDLVPFVGRVAQLDRVP